MFSLMEAFSIQGICATKAMEVGMIQLEALAVASWRDEDGGGCGTLMRPDRMSTSPRMEARSKLLPVPVLPLTTLSSFSGNEMSMFRKTYRSSPSSFSSSDGQAIDAFSKEIVGESVFVVFLVISGAERYFSIRLQDTQASIRSVVSSGMTASVTSRLLKTPMAVKATEGVRVP